MRRLLPLLVLPLVGCSKGSFNSARKASSSTEQILTYPLEAKVTTLDPGKVQDIGMTEVLANVFEGLVAYGENNEVSPCLAERWEVQDGGRTYVFHLRAAKFSDGTPLKASDFKRTWERNLGKELASPVAGDYLGAIVGAEAVSEGKAKEISGVKAVDDSTLQVTIDKPRPYFLGNLTYPCASVVSPNTDPTEMRTAAEAVGTGPFRLAKVAEDSEVDLEGNVGYWGGKPKLSKIARPVVIDASTRLSGYRNGSYDTIALQRGDVTSVEADPKLKAQLRLDPRPAIYFFSMNQKAYAPFRDVRVRRAFAMSLNRNKLVNDLLTGYTPANGLVAPGVPGYQKDYKGIAYDPKAAQVLLTEAGYPGGKGLPTLELAYRSGRPDGRLAVEAAATAWRKDLGAPVSPRALEWGALLKQRNGDKLQMGLGSWYADYLDPQNFLSLLLTSQSKMNHDGYSNKRFDALCDQADSDPDPARRMGLYQQAERIAVEDAARLPLYFENAPSLVSPRVKGLRTNLFGTMPHTQTEIGG